MNDLAEILLRGGQPNGELPIQGTFFRQFLPASHDVGYIILSIVKTKHHNNFLFSPCSDNMTLWPVLSHCLKCHLWKHVSIPCTICGAKQNTIWYWWSKVPMLVSR